MIVLTEVSLENMKIAVVRLRQQGYFARLKSANYSLGRSAAIFPFATNRTISLAGGSSDDHFQRKLQRRHPNHQLWRDEGAKQDDFGRRFLTTPGFADSIRQMRAPQSIVDVMPCP